jgi:hypothetical protein
MVSEPKHVFFLFSSAAPAPGRRALAPESRPPPPSRQAAAIVSLTVAPALPFPGPRGPATRLLPSRSRHPAPARLRTRPPPPGPAARPLRGPATQAVAIHPRAAPGRRASARLANGLPWPPRLPVHRDFPRSSSPPTLSST